MLGTAVLAATALVGGLFAVVEPPSGTNSLFAALVAGLAASAITALVGWQRLRKLGSAQREELEASAAEKAVSAIKTVLDAYIVDLDRAKTSIRLLESDLLQANQRIATLEAQIKEKDVDHEVLQERLNGALRERSALQDRVNSMRDHIDVLERYLSDRTGTPPQPLSSEEPE